MGNKNSIKKKQKTFLLCLKVCCPMKPVEMHYVGRCAPEKQGKQTHIPVEGNCVYFDQSCGSQASVSLFEVCIWYPA